MGARVDLLPRRRAQLYAASTRSGLGLRRPVWERAWDRVIPFLAFPEEIRRIVYTTNTVESLHMKIRKTIKTRGHFPNDDAALRLIWLAIQRAKSSWRSCYNWTQAMAVLRIHFGDRIPDNALTTHRYTEKRAGSPRVQKAESRSPALTKRRGRDLNPRSALRRITVFETAAFDRSATPPRRRRRDSNPRQRFVPL